MSTHNNENEIHPNAEEGLSVDQLAQHNNSGNDTPSAAATATRSNPVASSATATGTVGIVSSTAQMSAPEADQFRRPSSPLRAERRPKEEDEESALTNIDFTNQEVSAELDRNLNLSDYCISSDADTEKMESDSNENVAGDSSFAPKLSSLVQKAEEQQQQQESSVGTKRPLAESEQNDNENEDDAKRPKVEEPAVSEPPSPSTAVVPADEDENEAGDEDEGEDALEDEEEDEVAQSDAVAAPEEPVAGAPEPTVKTPEPVEKTPEVPKEETAEAPEEEQEEEPEEMEEEEDAANHDEEDEEEDEEEEEHSPEDNDENAQDTEASRQEALQDITAIEYQFAELRQKLYETKLYKLELELQMCMEGSHPELRGYYEKIASIRDYKLRRAYQRQKYMLKCIDRETHATRTFIHQGHQKQVCDVKNALLDNTTQQWYDINKERRDMDIVVPEVSYHVPVKTANRTLSCITGYAGPARMLLPGEAVPEDLACEGIEFKYKNNPVDKLEVIVDRMRLNNELSDLQGLKQFYHSFPGAPALNSLRDSEINEDFEILQAQLQATQQQQPHPQPQPQHQQQ